MWILWVTIVTTTILMWLQNLVGAWIVGTAEILLIFRIIWATLISGCFWSERCLCTFPSQHEHFYIKLFSHIVLGRLHHFLSDSNSAAVSERNWFDLAIVVSAVFEVLVLWQSDAISVMLVGGRGRLKTQFRSGCVVFFLNNRDSAWWNQCRSSMWDFEGECIWELGWWLRCCQPWKVIFVWCGQ